MRATHAANVYDFFKPSLGSEYPAVDGKLSQATYIAAVDACYEGLVARAAGGLRSAAGGAGVEGLFDHLAFHSPYNKLVQQSFKRLLFLDARAAARAGRPLPAGLEALAPWAGLPAAETLANRDLDKALGGVGAAAYARLVGPTEGLSKAIGNSYAAAVHANLVCLAAGKGAALEGKSVGAFSYGSGVRLAPQTARVPAVMPASDTPLSPRSRRRLRVSLRSRAGGRRARTASRSQRSGRPSTYLRGSRRGARPSLPSSRPRSSCARRPTAARASSP